MSSYHRLSGHSQLSDQEPTRVTKYSKSAVFQHHRRRNTNSLCLLKRGVHCYAWKQTLQAGAGWCAEEADLWPCILLPSLFLLLPPCRKEGRSLAGEKATGEHSNHRKKTRTKQKTLNISKQINKAMTKQYIYIYRYKKRKKNVQWFQYHLYTKCSHLYNNLESFFYFFLFLYSVFFSCIALSFSVPTSTISTAALQVHKEKKKEKKKRWASLPSVSALTQSRLRLGSLLLTLRRDVWKNPPQRFQMAKRPDWLLERWKPQVRLWHRLGLEEKKKKNCLKKNVFFWLHEESWGCQVCYF